MISHTVICDITCRWYYLWYQCNFDVISMLHVMDITGMWHAYPCNRYHRDRWYHCNVYVISHTMEDDIIKYKQMISSTISMMISHTVVCDIIKKQYVISHVISQGICKAHTGQISRLIWLVQKTVGDITYHGMWYHLKWYHMLLYVISRTRCNDITCDICYKDMHVTCQWYPWRVTKISPQSCIDVTGNITYR